MASQAVVFDTRMFFGSFEGEQFAFCWKQNCLNLVCTAWKMVRRAFQLNVCFLVYFLSLWMIMFIELLILSIRYLVICWRTWPL